VSDQDTELGQLLGMIVHDLRNPAATIGANVSFVKDSIPAADRESKEALDDVERALGDLMAGLEQVTWIARWLANLPLVTAADGDIVPALAALRPPPHDLKLVFDLPAGPLKVKSVSAAVKLVQVFVENAVMHARRGEIRVRALRVSDGVAVELVDGGKPLAPELRERAFTLEGQSDLKGRADGRYGRVAGLFAAGLLSNAIGARIEPGEVEGKAVWRIVFAPAD
jgi:signal transduction histidine kinase